MKRIRNLILIVLLMAIAAGAWYWIQSGLTVSSLVGSSSDKLQQWVGGQLKTIANHYLRPTFEFDRLEYEYPATVTLRNVTLTDAGETFIEVASMRIVLAETPSVGQPVVIEAVELVDPKVRFIRGSEGSLVGFTDFIETRTGEVSEDGSSTRPSDVFAIRRIDIERGIVSYEAGEGPPMYLDGITLDLNVNPEADPGWYTMSATLARENTFEIESEAHLSIDTGDLVLNRTSIDVELQQDRYQVFPPDLQGWVRDHEVHGHLAIWVEGKLPLSDPITADLLISTMLTEARITFGDYILPVQSLELLAHFQDRQLRINPLSVFFAEGTLEATGTIEATDDFAAEFEVETRGVRLENLLRQSEEGGRDYAGLIDLTGRVGASLSDILPSLNGEGQLTISEGRLISFPVVAEISKKTGDVSQRPEGQDKVTALVEVADEQVKFRNIQLVSSMSAARGNGEIGFDGQVNFRLNAGPLEKAQQKMGPVGELFGLVTDRLVTYHVTGPLKKPVVTVRPLGIGTD